jgi:hypothetical protein
VSPGASSSSGSSWRSGTPSPPPASSSFSDEGIAMDYEEVHPRKKRVSHMNLNSNSLFLYIQSTALQTIKLHQKIFNLIHLTINHSFD